LNSSQKQERNSHSIFYHSFQRWSVGDRGEEIRVSHRCSFSWFDWNFIPSWRLGLSILFERRFLQMDL